MQNVCVYDPPKSLNDSLAVGLPYQTLAVDFSRQIYRLALLLCAPEMLSLLNAHLALLV